MLGAELPTRHLDIGMAGDNVGPPELTVGDEVASLRCEGGGAGKPRRDGRRVLAASFVGTGPFQALEAPDLSVRKKLLLVSHQVGSRLLVGRCIQCLLPGIA